eukprot:TRINITY_DN19001_c0_g1_i1.p2 TRINITY_DN19001_c0_g1~~TRINITY_DN19001_c0_g1_i1.p2  ORF type:complete len:306 (+),score=105.26 TRINITY_DN19001_c0_g1_i1:87-920(+)
MLGGGARVLRQGGAAAAAGLGVVRGAAAGLPGRSALRSRRVVWARAAVQLRACASGGRPALSEQEVREIWRATHTQEGGAGLGEGFAEAPLQLDQLRPLADALVAHLPPEVHNVAAELLLSRAAQDAEGLRLQSALGFADAIRRGSASGAPVEQTLFKAVWATYIGAEGDGRLDSADAGKCCKAVWQGAKQRPPPQLLQSPLLADGERPSAAELLSWMEENALPLPPLAAADSSLKRRSTYGSYLGMALAFGIYWWLSSTGLLSKALRSNPITGGDK